MFVFTPLLDWLYPQAEKNRESALLGAFRCTPVIVDGYALRTQGVLHLDRLVAAANYASSRALQESIQLFKYGRRRSLAPSLGLLLSVASGLLSKSTEQHVLCPVPLHWSRRFARGFNQAELLAREVAHATGMPLTLCLRRTRPTGHQAWRTHSERRLAMQDAFVALQPAPSHVILIDDVATTVSTLDACACALKHAGVQHVQALVVALG